MNLLDRLNKWLKPKPVPAPVPDKPEPEPTPHPRWTNYLQAWNMLRKIPFQKLTPALLSVSTVLFFAISGFVAWVVLICSWIVKTIKKLVS